MHLPANVSMETLNHKASADSGAFTQRAPNAQGFSKTKKVKASMNRSSKTPLPLHAALYSHGRDLSTSPTKFFKKVLFFLNPTRRCPNYRDNPHQIAAEAAAGFPAPPAPPGIHDPGSKRVQDRQFPFPCSRPSLTRCPAPAWRRQPSQSPRYSRRPHSCLPFRSALPHRPHDGKYPP